METAMSKPMTLDELLKKWQPTLSTPDDPVPVYESKRDEFEMARRLRVLDGYTRKLTPQMGRAVRRILNGERL